MFKPKCPRCNMEMVKVDEHRDTAVYACPECDMPGEPHWAYENHCWNCQSEISSETCRASNIPGMGYHCNFCGEDLVGWHVKNGNITHQEVARILQRNQFGGGINAVL